jgi:hypothetical protein
MPGCEAQCCLRGENDRVLKQPLGRVGALRLAGEAKEPRYSEEETSADHVQPEMRRQVDDVEDSQFVGWQRAVAENSEAERDGERLLYPCGAGSEEPRGDDLQGAGRAIQDAVNAGTYEGHLSPRGTRPPRERFVG